MEKNEMLVPDRILQLLEMEGINTLFGIPDPCFVTMFALAEQRGWRVIAPHHEQAGGFMADGLYRLTGKPGHGTRHAHTEIAVALGESPDVAGPEPAARGEPVGRHREPGFPARIPANPCQQVRRGPRIETARGEGPDVGGEAALDRAQARGTDEDDEVLCGLHRAQP